MKKLKIREYAVIIFVVLGVLAFAFEKKLEPKVYNVKSVGEGFHGNIKLDVKAYKNAKNEIRYVSIEYTHEDTPAIAGPAIDNLINQVMTKQSTKLDSVAGATWTSEGFKDAIRDAEKQLQNIK